MSALYFRDESVKGLINWINMKKAHKESERLQESSEKWSLINKHALIFDEVNNNQSFRSIRGSYGSKLWCHERKSKDCGSHVTPRLAARTGFNVTVGWWNRPQCLKNQAADFFKDTLISLILSLMHTHTIKTHRNVIICRVSVQFGDFNPSALVFEASSRLLQTDGAGRPAGCRL